MSLEVNAIYENGCLKLDHPLPFDDQQRVRVLVLTEGAVARHSYGIIGWKGAVQTVRQAALGADTGLLKSS